MKSMKKRLGLESILFQNKNFGKELELIIESIRASKLTIKEINQSKFKTTLEKCINDNTNLNTSLVFSDVPGATFMLFATLNINAGIYHESVFSEVTNDDLSKFANSVSRIKDHYEVNLKTGKVGGFYGKQENTLGLEYSAFITSKRFTVPEVVGVILHEVGHAFTQLEYGTRCVMTNQALAAISYSLLNKNTPEQHLVYVRAAADLLDLSKEALDDMTGIKDNKIIATMIVDRAVINKKSELGTDYYDSVSVEYLADQYAARYGYAVPLASAIHKNSYGTPDRSKLSRTILKIVEIFTFILKTALLSVVFTFASVGGFLILGYLMISFLLDGKSKMKVMTYDTLVVRHKRLREQVIEQLKDLSIPKEEMLQLLDDHKVISNFIDKTKEFSTLYSSALSILFKSRRDAKAAMDLQRTMEELASNTLFVQSAKLRSLQT